MGPEFAALLTSLAIRSGVIAGGVAAELAVRLARVLLNLWRTR